MLSSRVSTAIPQPLVWTHLECDQRHCVGIYLWGISKHSGIYYGYLFGIGILCTFFGFTSEKFWKEKKKRKNSTMFRTVLKWLSGVGKHQCARVWIGNDENDGDGFFFFFYMRNWATRLATPSRMRALWKSTEGQRSRPCLLSEIMCTNAGKTKTRARPHVAPENLHGRHARRQAHTSIRFFLNLMSAGCVLKFLEKSN